MQTTLLISSICFLVMMMMYAMVRNNATLSEMQRTGFEKTFLSVAFVIVLELASIYLNGANVVLKPLHFFVNVLGFSLSPMVVFSIVLSIAKESRIKHYRRANIAYLTFLIASLPFGMIFSIDSNNIYKRGSFFGVFVAFYLFQVLILVKETFHMYSNFQKTGKRLLIPMLVVTLFGTFIQVMKPDFQIAWIAITFTVIIYYIHCSNLWHQTEGLTGLLSQKVYLYDLKKTPINSLVYIFDVDNFKALNDEYGHNVGDEVLKIVANVILEVYGKFGTCYRIGGDEMSVILHTPMDSLSKDAMFYRRLQEIRKEKRFLPNVSYGCAVLSENKDPMSVKNEADWSMYQNKNQRYY